MCLETTSKGTPKASRWLLSNSAHSQVSPCLDQLALFSSITQETFNLCTQPQPPAPAGPRGRAGRVSAQPKDAGLTCPLAAATPGVAAHLPNQCAARGTGPTPLAPSGCLLAFQPLLSRSLGFLGSPQKVKVLLVSGHGTWQGELHSQDMRSEHGGPLVHPEL